MISKRGDNEPENRSSFAQSRHRNHMVPVRCARHGMHRGAEVFVFHITDFLPGEVFLDGEKVRFSEKRLLMQAGKVAALEVCGVFYLASASSTVSGR
jgi:hypothetical protein